MRESSRNFLVGLFLLGALVTFGLLMVWFGETPGWLQRGEWTMRIVGVRDLSGIGEGTPVNLNGVEIGRVRRLDFRDLERPDRGVLIETRIKQRFSVPSGAFAKVYGATFGFGTGRIDLVVDAGRSLEPLAKDGEAVLPGEMRSIVGEFISRDTVDSFQRAMDRIANVAAAAEPVMANINHLVEKRTIADVSAPGATEKGVVANLGTVLERIDGFIANLDEVVGDDRVQEDVKTAVRELRGASEDLRATVALWKTETQKLADNLNGGIDSTEARLDDSFRKLNTVLENLDSATGDLAVVSRGAREGRGTVGLLLNDPRAYEALVLSLERLAAVLSDVQVITGKIRDDGYITVGQAPGGLLKAKLMVGGGGASTSALERP